MRINIKHLPSHQDPKLIRDVMRFYADQLMDTHVGIRIDVRFSRDLRSRYNTIGCVYWSDRRRKPKHLTMELCSNLGVNKLLKVIAHEMIHVRQYVSGDLVDLRDSRCVLWRGARRRWYANGTVRYENSPWEIEAYDNEIGLYKRFVQQEFA